MPRENLQVHPIFDFSEESINEMVTGINQRFDQVMEILEEHEGLNGKKMTQQNDLDMNGFSVIGVKNIQLKEGKNPKGVTNTVRNLVQQLTKTIKDPIATPATATVLRDDLVANTIPHLESIFRGLEQVLNDIIVVIEERGPR